jgi:hypothetical protein
MQAIANVLLIAVSEKPTKMRRWCAATVFLLQFRAYVIKWCGIFRAIVNLQLTD